MLVVYVIIGIVCGVITAQIASKRNRSVGGFFLLGLILGIIGIIVAVLVPSGEPPAPAGMRAVTCPRCNARRNVDATESHHECWQCKLVSSAMSMGPL